MVFKFEDFKFESSGSANLTTETRVIDTACDWVHPITITESEMKVLTPETKRQVLALSVAYNKNCRAVGAVPAGGVSATQ